MSDTTNPTVLQVIQEDIPNFNKNYLIYIKDDKFSTSNTNIVLTLRSDLDRLEFEKEFELIYHPELEAHFFKELNNFNKKLICNELILSNKVFFTSILSVDEYNVLINSENKNIEDKLSEIKEALQ